MGPGFPSAVRPGRPGVRGPACGAWTGCERAAAVVPGDALLAADEGLVAPLAGRSRHPAAHGRPGPASGFVRRHGSRRRGRRRDGPGAATTRSSPGSLAGERRRAGRRRRGSSCGARSREESRHERRARPVALAPARHRRSPPSSPSSTRRPRSAMSSAACGPRGRAASRGRRRLARRDPAARGGGRRSRHRGAATRLRTSLPDRPAERAGSGGVRSCPRRRIRTSPGRRAGFGTSSTRTFSLPYKTAAFMRCGLDNGESKARCNAKVHYCLIITPILCQPPGPFKG